MLQTQSHATETLQSVLQLNVQSSKLNPIYQPLIALPTISQVDSEHFLMHELCLTAYRTLHPQERIKINSASTSFLLCSKVKFGGHWTCI